jgi:hypothetical protein
MLITLRGRGYVRHIVTLHCSSDNDVTMFITLRRKGYAHHIATTWLCSSHCDDMDMLVTW